MKTAPPEHSNILNKDGSINRQKMKLMAFEGAISASIDMLNKNWFIQRGYGGGYYGSFYVCDVTSACELIKREWYGKTEYKYLKNFHCVSWNSMSDKTRDGIIAVTMSLLDHSRIGYDLVTNQWFDMNTRPNIIEGQAVTPPLLQIMTAQTTPAKKSAWDRLKKWLFKG